ncbi:MAG: UvrD-helicase domain-containing protein [Deltaproteobacteria bacterium]|nr:UvrD-helicase domain-containing protein [Deltaproteobacteria bacterium]
MSLNPQQIEAVHHEKGPLLILAGAGTGKTRVLTHRIEHLVKNCGISSGRILAVTFTNKAAGEMKKRLEGLIGVRARELWVGTFHSVCVKLLRRHALEAGIAPSFIIYDGADQLSVLKKVLKDLNLDEKKLPPNSLVHRISRLKDQLTSAADLLDQATDPFQKTLAKVYEAYEKTLSANNALDFGDLIYKTVLLFQKQPHVLKSYQNLWQQILVDEYQDTNHAQYEMIKLLAAGHNNLCVVGDPDQSIYRWRGADLNNILNFEKDYPQAISVRLEQNYRSVQNVLSAASAVIANNELRKEKSLWSDNGAGEKITIVATNSEKEEAKYIVETLRQLHVMEKINYSEMAIFYRTNAQSRPLEETLRMAGIPYIIYGGTRFYERAEVKDALAYLRIFLSPEDSVGFKRIINVPARGIGKTTIEKIEMTATLHSVSFYEALGLMRDHPKLKSFLDWFETLKGQMSGLSLTGLLQQILETSGYITSLSAQGSVEAQERLSNLNELMASVADFEAQGNKSLQDYLDQVALISDLDQGSEGGILPLMTLHLAKGLEFKAVALVGLEEGLLPHSRSQNEIEELEEERRLFYVGITRAKERLWITHAWRRYMNGQEQYSLASRFLEEIPAELVDRVDRSTRLEVKEERRFDNDDFDQTGEWEVSLRGPKDRSNPDDTGIATSPSAPRNDGFRIGTNVRHPDFGVGYVAATEKTSLGEKVTVKFANGMIKKLIAEYAHLEKI